MIPVEPKPNVTNTATHTKKTQWTKEIQKNKHTAIVRPARLRRGGGGVGIARKSLPSHNLF